MEFHGKKQASLKPHKQVSGAGSGTDCPVLLVTLTAELPSQAVLREMSKGHKIQV